MEKDNRNLIQVDQSKCTKCGSCSKVCPTGFIGMDENGPKVVGQFCISCGHCVAVCHSAALDNVKTPLANQVELEKTPVLDEDTASRFLRSRRSIREFQNKPVPREKIEQLLNVARFAPTSGNSQGVSYHVIDNPDTLRKITSVAVDWLEEALKHPPYAGSPLEAPFTSHVRHYRETGDDVVLRNAPCLVIPIVHKSSSSMGHDSTLFSLAYAELYATSIGLGSCITGFFDACAAAGYKPLLDILNLPENMKVTGGLMVGFPKYTYKRLVDRSPLQVTWGK
ncbi:nitroreductase family protein [Clostridium beijerinckii]|uniref:nitroreductase family protein n=1 Tax=Clostridium beijerinckii TaxID=1520 RepID=UPI001360DADA|nr:nitroreductase family protein [Clostridium beijerinckii]MZK49146.1 4Fe-4S dicluster domain-containing protein [Clostridium beijerinckii]MZK56977.1 4Fe-4S dicluster domain-containing protein [Clostridium beijerinckii]MZK67188.1 4Fe-4S dicluster domain-containing protein [Clostridium beijerinckii]MZK72815.1 4Fe-4S dicluster domain-containing protein [Clostridium beijerinckii]MZK82411.1 4Fe-4S dicluster domain-containing protein [Clostridium beijerinckii]